jgi:hypothetical protein
MCSKSRLALILVAACAFARSARAQDDYYEGEAPPPEAAPAAQYYGYVGVHPIPYEVGSGFCYQTAAHFHEYAPFDSYLFRQANGYFYFVGDPMDFGYTLAAWGYQGHHPIPVEYGGGYCYIDWPHRHHYAPPPGVSYNFVNGYYTYYGAWDPWYYQYRNYYTGYYGGYYRNYYYGNRYYTVRPPAVYRPALRVGAPGVYRPGVTVAAPGMRAGVVVGAPAVGVRVGAPAPVYRGGVTVGAPAAGVRVGAPAPVYRAPAPAAPAPVYRAAPAPAPVYRAPAPAAPAPVYRAAPAPAPVYRAPAPAAPVHVAPPAVHHR